MSQKTKNYFLEEIKQNQLMSRKHKMVCATLNYIDHFLILVSTVTWCISISIFVSLLGSPIGIKSSVIGLKGYAIATRIKKYWWITKKRKKSMIK